MGNLNETKKEIGEELCNIPTQSKKIWYNMLVQKAR